MEAAGSGSGTALLNIHSAGNRTDDRQLDYTLITPDVQVLLVDDDGAENYETAYYGPALASTGRSFAIWPRGAAALTGSILANFDAVVWNIGLAYPTLDADDRAALTEYLNGGGKLFVSGQDIGWELNDIGGEAILWYRQYLHALYVADDTNDMTLDGVPGDPIGNGISLNISGGDGANNQDYPSDIDPADANSSAVFTYSTGRYGAVKADTGTYRTVYFSFATKPSTTRMRARWSCSASWTGLLPDLTERRAPRRRPWCCRQNLPNPLNPKTSIATPWAKPGPVTLSVFDVEGRLVKVLDQGMRAAGSHEAVWDGTDAAGRPLARACISTPRQRERGGDPEDADAEIGPSEEYSGSRERGRPRRRASYKTDCRCAARIGYNRCASTDGPVACREEAGSSNPCGREVRCRTSAILSILLIVGFVSPCRAFVPAPSSEAGRRLLVTELRVRVRRP